MMYLVTNQINHDTVTTVVKPTNQFWNTVRKYLSGSESIRLCRCMFNNDLHRGLKLRLYKACICSILTYGSEAWTLTTETTRALNGANAQMMAGITGNTPQQEASKKIQNLRRCNVDTRPPPTMARSHPAHGPRTTPQASCL